MKKTLFLVSMLLSSTAYAGTQDYGVPKEQRKPYVDAVISDNTRSVIAGINDDGDHEMSVATDNYEFKYFYPTLVSRYIPLSDHLTDIMRQLEYALAVRAEKDRAARVAMGKPEFYRHELIVNWQVVADLPNWLSLSTDVRDFGGTWQGDYATFTILYDKRAGRVSRPLELFQSAKALNAAIAPRLCAALSEVQALQGQMAEQTGGIASWDCPYAGGPTALLGSRNGKTFDRVTVITPYIETSAGFENPVAIHLDVDATLLKAVKPEYAMDFTIAQ